jgi:hypothetical protein
VSRKVPELTQTGRAVPNGDGYTLATRAGKRKGICQHRTHLLVQLLADAVQPGPTALERMPNSFAASSTLIPSTTPRRKQFVSFGEILGGQCDKL